METRDRSFDVHIQDIDSVWHSRLHNTLRGASTGHKVTYNITTSDGKAHIVTTMLGGRGFMRYSIEGEVCDVSTRELLVHLGDISPMRRL